LALELAAARIGSLSPVELASRLDRALAVLVSGARDAPERQRTLRATIDWSYGLLSEVERSIFARMAIFVGGATVATAEEVTDASLETLDALVSKQMLVRRNERLLMLETVREYALEQHGRAPDADASYHRLAAWCLRFTRAATPHLARADRAEWRAKLDAEYPNALAALSWALDGAQEALALQLVGALGDYWWRTGRWADGLPWVDAALQSEADAPPEVRARALLYRARLAGSRRPQPHREDIEASLTLFRACHDAAGIAVCLAHLATLENLAGHNDQATALADEAIDVAEGARDEDALAFALVQSAMAATTYEQVAGRARTAITHLQNVGDLRQSAYVCNVTAYQAIAEGRYHDALAWLDEGLEASRPLGELDLLYLIRGNQGLAHLFLDHLAEAGQWFRDALAVCREGGSEDIVDETLLGLAAATARQGDLEHAAQLAGAARAHPSIGNMPSEVGILSEISEMVAEARERLGPGNWDAAERRGGTLTVPEAIDLALARGRFAQAAPETVARLVT
jgi:tetratricopeptide (TPR) repeat protein